MSRYMQNKTAIIRPLIRQFEHDEHYSVNMYEHFIGKTFRSSSHFRL